MHELATNAAKYGALSAPGGKLAVTWAVNGAGEARRLKVHWREAGGPPVTPPSRRGFGSRLVERGITQELKGSVELDYAASGLRCLMEIPLPNFG
jgi:two-component sensor histidine kinase